LAPVRVNVAAMDEDDFFSSRPQDPLSLLVKQDLGPLSVDELQVRISALRGEIGRVERHIANVTAHRSAADALFKK
jgi:uncharacterized small protein (DUF1192 family)